jgi:hypothetical protein
MNSEERLKNKLRFAKAKEKIKQGAFGSSKVLATKPTPDVFDSPLPNIVLGDMLGTGIIGGIDMDVTTPL